MRSNREALEDSRDFWQQAASSDKVQFKLSFVMAGVGLVLAADGVRNLFKGDIGGSLEAALGGTIFAGSVRSASSEIEDYAETRSMVNFRQNELDKLPE